MNAEPSQSSNPRLVTMPVDHSATPQEACDRFLQEIRSWFRDSERELENVLPLNGHDQGTFTTAWVSYINATGDQEPLNYMKRLRDEISQHFNRSERWHHGYWKAQEVHHGTEHFELFLGALAQLDPKDGATQNQLIDAVEHIGNWADGVPEWFNWEDGTFRSMFLGTETVRIGPDTAVNVADHFRLVNLCLIAYDLTQEARYIELPRIHVGLWAEAILADERLPVGLRAGRGVYGLSDTEREKYRSFTGAAPELTVPIARAENFLASNTLDAFLALWTLTQDASLRAAAERLLDVVATDLESPQAGAAADALRRYRRLTGDSRYDAAAEEALLKASERIDPFEIAEIAIDAQPPKSERLPGIGHRQDIPDWYENGRPRAHNPLTLAFVAEIRNDPRLATLAVDLARTYFLLARQVYPHGHEHGCSARSVSAVARGHGRENNAGVITGALDPIMSHFTEILG